MPENVKFEPVSKQKMKEFGIDYTKILVRELLRAGKRASGQLVKSINYKSPIKSTPQSPHNPIYYA